MVRRLISGLLLCILPLAAFAQMNGGIMGSQRQGAAAITSGAIDGTTIGATTPAAITGTTVTANTSFGLSGTQYLFLDAANIIACRNGTSACNVRLYGTYTDASNYERITLGFDSVSTSNLLNVEAAGTGTQRALAIAYAGTRTWQFQRPSSGSHLVAITDNSFDIGTSGANRPRTGYFGTDVRAPRFIAAGGTSPTCSSNCGTSPSVAGNDGAFTVTMGASGSPASGWVVTFNGTWPAAPSCHVQMALAGMVVGKMALTAVTTTTTLTVVTNGTAPANSDKYHVICMGV